MHILDTHLRQTADQHRSFCTWANDIINIELPELRSACIYERDLYFRIYSIDSCSCWQESTLCRSLWNNIPNTEVQLCVVHQISNAQKGLQSIYNASTKELAERNLDQLERTGVTAIRRSLSPGVENWPRLSNYFQYNKDIRRIMYTTNIIEGFHRQLISELQQIRTSIAKEF
jgi:transposase-like protein